MLTEFQNEFRMNGELGQEGGYFDTFTQIASLSDQIDADLNDPAGGSIIDASVNLAKVENVIDILGFNPTENPWDTGSKLLFSSTDEDGGTKANQFGIGIMQRVLGDGVDLSNIATADWNRMASDLVQDGSISDDDMKAILEQSKMGDTKHGKRKVETALTISGSLQRMHTDAAELSSMLENQALKIGASPTEASSLKLQKEQVEYLKNMLLYMAQADTNFFSRIYVDEDGEIGADLWT